MFVYESVDRKWISILQSFKKPMADNRKPAVHWYTDHQKQEALYYIGWVSSSINRSYEEGPGCACDYYDFAFIFKEYCFKVNASIYDCDSEWNEKNKISYYLITEIGPYKLTDEKKSPEIFLEMNKQELESEMKEAIIHYLNNHYYDSRKLKEADIDD